MSTPYDDLIKQSKLSQGSIAKTLKQRVLDSVQATISNDITEDNNTATISIEAKDKYSDDMPSFLLYIDELPLQEHGILHNIYNAQYFGTPDALNGVGLFQTYTDGLATGIQISDVAIATGSIYQHDLFGNVQQIALDFSASASGTSVDITLPQIAYSGITKQAMMLRYRIHKSDNASLTNNVSATLTADEQWHFLAKTVTSPIAPKITVTSNVVNDTDNTTIEFATYYAYNLDSTTLPEEVSTFLTAVNGQTYLAYSDMDDNALGYARIYETLPQLPSVFRTNGEYDAIITATENTVSGMVDADISTPTNTVTLNNDYISGYESVTCATVKKSPFTYIATEQQISSVSNNTATMSQQLTSGEWRIYYPATITLSGYAIAEQYTKDVSNNTQSILQAIPFSIPINLIIDTHDLLDRLPDNYKAYEYQYRNSYSVTFSAV